jgi:carbonic anhydrase
MGATIPGRMERILAGVAHFQSNVFPHEREMFAHMAHEQHPRALFITCADSRVLPNLITQTQPGELFICRDVGNIVPAYGSTYGGVSATIEYAVSVLEVRHVIICGHSDCGAIAVLLQPEKVRDLPSVAAWLAHAEAARRTVLENHPELTGEDLHRALIEQNVVTQLRNLKTHPAVAARMASGKVAVHGWNYTIETGEVQVYDEATSRYVPATSLLGAGQPGIDLSHGALLAR